MASAAKLKEESGDDAAVVASEAKPKEETGNGAAAGMVEVDVTAGTCGVAVAGGFDGTLKPDSALGLVKAKGESGLALAVVAGTDRALVGVTKPGRGVGWPKGPSYVPFCAERENKAARAAAGGGVKIGQPVVFSAGTGGIGFSGKNKPPWEVS